VAANGGLGGFGSGLSLKQSLLHHEGVFITTKATKSTKI
jgi:hypothetical protein